MVSTTENRRYLIGVAAFYIALIVAILFVPQLQPKGLPIEDLHRLVATLAVWMMAVVAAELLPMTEVAKTP